MARVTHRSSSYPMQSSDPSSYEKNRGSLGWPAIMPYARGMQPIPQDARKLKKLLTKLNWDLRLVVASRADLVVLTDRRDKQIARLRRERDAYADALQSMDPELYEQAEQQRRDWDNPKLLLEWAQRGGPEHE
jgi:hypothetical protein